MFLKSNGHISTWERAPGKHLERASSEDDWANHFSLTFKANKSDFLLPAEQVKNSPNFPIGNTRVEKSSSAAFCPPFNEEMSTSDKIADIAPSMLWLVFFASFQQLPVFCYNKILAKATASFSSKDANWSLNSLFDWKLHRLELFKIICKNSGVKSPQSSCLLRLSSRYLCG